MMKKLLLLILNITIIFNINAQDKSNKGLRDKVFIDKKIYQVYYSEVLKNPLEVHYNIYKPQSNASRKGLTFKKENGVVTATNKDFESNQYDKGHLAPAETFSDSKTNLELTFSYVNCAVQHFELNRNAWRLLEAYERSLADEQPIKVINKVIFEKGYKKLYTGTAIPTHFEKIIIKLNSKDTLHFRFPNEKCSHNIYDYQIK